MSLQLQTDVKFGEEKPMNNNPTELVDSIKAIIWMNTVDDAKDNAPVILELIKQHYETKVMEAIEGIMEDEIGGLTDFSGIGNGMNYAYKQALKATAEVFKK